MGENDATHLSSLPELKRLMQEKNPATIQFIEGGKLASVIGTISEISDQSLSVDQTNIIPLQQVVFVNQHHINNPFAKNSAQIQKLLKSNSNLFGPVTDFEITKENTCPIDLTINNPIFDQVDLSDIKTLTRLFMQVLSKNNSTAAIGGYGENRMLYALRDRFESDNEPRTTHLGIDIWIKDGSPLLCPYDGVVHSFIDNTGFGNYGPTIVLEHQLEDTVFYTLYGHLSRTSLDGLQPGKHFQKGERIAWVGNDTENGNWPPHLHFQVMTTHLEQGTDFIGVCKPSETAFYFTICPDPNLILRCDFL
jgi:murein DD-endopeptidase MepM/ murein hydrolase activator NlpD